MIIMDCDCLQINASYVRSIGMKGNSSEYIAIAGLDLEIGAENFKQQRLHVVCRANVFHLYDRRVEVVIEQERPILAPVLGTRDTGASSYTGIYII